MNRPPRDAWERLLEASAPVRRHRSPDDLAPAEFAARTAARWTRSQIPPGSNAWERLLAVAKYAAATARDPDPASPAPFGFATRVAAHWQATRTGSAAPVLLWRRWSLRGLACSLAILALTLASVSHQPPAGQELSLLPVPALDVPHLSPTP